MTLWLLLACPLRPAAQPFLSLQTQGEVDSVPILFPNLTEVYTLIIGYASSSLSDIHDLTPLSSIQNIQGDLRIRNNPLLKSLNGLHNIDSIGGNVYSHIINNDSLTDLTGLQLRHVGEQFIIKQNDMLASLNGLNRIKQIARLSIAENPSLQSLVGLDSLEKVTLGLGVSANALAGFDLPQLRVARSMSVSDEPFLTSFSGLLALDTIRLLSIYENPALASLDGLEGVAFMTDGGLTINRNPVLSDIGALSTIAADTMGGVTFEENPLAGPSISFPSLKAVNVLIIHNNPSLKSLDFPLLERVGYNPVFIGLNMEITKNDSLAALHLPLLSAVAEHCIIEENGGLADFSGMGSIETVGGDFRIWYNAALQTLTGLENLESVGGNFQINANKSLQSFCEFAHLDSIGADLEIYGDSSLVSLQGLDSLKAVGKDVLISHNAVLTDISALTHLDSMGWNAPSLLSWPIAKFHISECPLLPKVDYSLGNLQQYPINTFYLGENNSLDSVILPFVEDTYFFWVQNNQSLTHLSFPSLQNLGGGGAKFLLPHYPQQRLPCIHSRPLHHRAAKAPQRQPQPAQQSPPQRLRGHLPDA